MIGATPKFIRSPIILEAVIYATIGVFVGWVLTLILILYLTPTIISYFGQIPVLPKETLSFFGLFGVILLVEAAIGVILALMGSMLAISRARRAR